MPRFFAALGSCLTFCLVAAGSLPSAAKADPEASAAETGPESRIEFSGYATMNYHHFDWQTDPQRRDAVDLERVAIEAEYRISPRMVLESELEFEHGGTGSTMEFDKLEEFGEFESEVEKGGEIRIEELALSFLLHPAFNVRVGHFIVPIGFAAKLDEPVDYFTVERSEAERSMLPVLWDETGAEIFGDLPGLHYQLQVVNGLDASAFSSGNWVALGHQGRFETVNAENWAVAGRLDARAIPGVLIGVSGYFGNSRDNRPKPDLDQNAYVSIVSTHAQWTSGPFTLRALGILGNLTNSEAVTDANKNLSNNLNVKRSPVARQAYAAFAEAGVDVIDLLVPHRGNQSGVVFVRFDSYDTMHKTEGAVFDNPRWDRQVYTAGVNYMPHSQVVLKGQYAHRETGEGVLDDTYSFGLGVVVF